METSEEAAAVGSLPSQGALIHGFFVEGARWNLGGQVSTYSNRIPGMPITLLGLKRGHVEQILTDCINFKGDK